MEAGATWGVEYQDGSTYLRFTGEQENRWDAIDWARVTRVAFASGEAEAEFLFTHPGDEYDVRLGSRVGVTPREDHSAVRCLMIVTHLKGQPISDQSVKHVFFWMPDGTSHDCDQFNCPDVARYLHCLVNRVPASLAVSHTSLRAHLTASLA